METITTTLTTEAFFNDCHTKRYLLNKTWDDSLPKITVIMLAPSEASGVALDTTTQLCLNNASRLGYGSIFIVNLFATVNDFDLKPQEPQQPEKEPEKKPKGRPKATKKEAKSE